MNPRRSTVLTYPSSTDYVAAVQDPNRAFRVPSLCRAEFARDPLFDIPMPTSGTSAVVFPAKVDGKDQALRFFIRKDASEKQRYDALSRHFAANSLGDCTAAMTWIDDAIVVNGQSWPMIQMEWVTGQTLDTHVGKLVDRVDVGALHVLAATWRDQVKRLQNAEFAHGDLQHGNVLVDTSNALRLVDFDGSWIAEFDGWPEPPEKGQPNYQLPSRIWGRWMDTFPALVIYTGLLAVSRQPDAWKALHDSEDILFTSDDFLRPGSTETWSLLAEINDPDVVHALRRLQACCRSRWSAAESLEELLGRERIDQPTQAVPVRDPFPGVSDRPARNWWDGASPPPPRMAPPADPIFTGVMGTGSTTGPRSSGPATGSGAPVPPHQRPAPAPRKGTAFAIAAGIAMILAVIIGVAAGEEDADGVTAALITVLIAFPVLLVLLRSRR